MRDSFKPLLMPQSQNCSDSRALPRNTVETAFLIPKEKYLWVDASGWSDKATAHYAFETAREPGNLRNLVQRVFHHVARKDAEETFGALVDLFIVLGGQGMGLRARMLTYARDVLTGEQHASLEQLLRQPPRGSEDYPAAPCSLLGNEDQRFKPLLEPLD